MDKEQRIVHLHDGIRGYNERLHTYCGLWVTTWDVLHRELPLNAKLCKDCLYEPPKRIE